MTNVSKSITRPVVTVQKNKRITNLIESGVRLYLPVDDKGNVQEVSKGVRLECWVSVPDQKREKLAEVFEYSAAGLARALLKAADESMYGTLPMAAAHMSLSRLNDWFYTLHRCAEGDVIEYTHQSL